jgi:DNA polymerase
MTKTELLKQIKEEVVNLKKSPLYDERIKNRAFPVIGEGNHDAKILFIGEAPGANEAKTGKPFCGRAGEILNFCLEKIDLDREKVYITNIIKDRPPQNRDPSIEEIIVYSPFLDRQIKIIGPKIIATLGRFSGEYILKKFNLEEDIKPISKLHGNVFSGETESGIIKIIPLLHPAVAIYQQSKKESLLQGFFNLKKLIEEEKIEEIFWKK